MTLLGEVLCDEKYLFEISFELLAELMSNGLVVKALDSNSRGSMFKIAGWLQGQPFIFPRSIKLVVAL